MFLNCSQHFWQLETVTVSGCCLIKLLPYILFQKYMCILALEMASPGNQHCANCIGTLSFPMILHRAVFLTLLSGNCECKNVLNVLFIHSRFTFIAFYLANVFAFRHRRRNAEQGLCNCRTSVRLSVCLSVAFRNVRRILVRGSKMSPFRLRRRKLEKFDYEMVHPEVYLNKYVVSIAPFSTPACPDCSQNIT